MQAEDLCVCLAASSGGHLTQLLKVTGDWESYDTFVVTTSDVVREAIRRFGRAYTVGECNRDHPLRVIAVLARCLWILVRERPDVVVSTGAAPGCLICLLGILFGAKVVWLDSIANVGRLSLSGRLVRPIASKFLVQWPELVERYPGVEYEGTVL